MYNSSPSFPPFSLSRLMSTCFGHGEGEGDRLCILIDLPDLSLMHGLAFLNDDGFAVQKYAYETFHKGFNGELLAELKYRQNDFFAFNTTGGSNLDPDDEVTDAGGADLSLERDVYPHYDLILAITDYSLTAPLTAMAKKHGFRGATLHGVNPIILESGLSVDYRDVSVQAERFRTALTLSDAFELDFEALGETTTLRIECGGQEAQKSHGLCPRGKPDVANLPAGEVYFVPESVHGIFPFKYAEETIGLLHVKDGKIYKSQFVYGDYELIRNHNERLVEDPMIGAIGELGFGTQVLPFSGRDIQDEKVFGTVHIATGRDDHLGGNITPDLFKEHKNASHDDILYALYKTPEIRLPEVRMNKDGKTTVLIQNYIPSEFLVNLISS